MIDARQIRELRRDLASAMMRQQDSLEPLALEWVTARKLLWVLDDLCASDNRSSDGR